MFLGHLGNLCLCWFHLTEKNWGWNFQDWLSTGKEKRMDKHWKTRSHEEGNIWSIFEYFLKMYNS